MSVPYPSERIKARLSSKFDYLIEEFKDYVKEVEEEAWTEEYKEEQRKFLRRLKKARRKWEFGK